MTRIKQIHYLIVAKIRVIRGSILGSNPKSQIRSPKWLGVGADQPQSGRFLNSEHQVHVLDGLAGGAFDEVVDR